MKKVFYTLFALSLVALFGVAFAQESMVVTHTKNWKSVPITVDTTGNTYTVVGTDVPTSGDYYYSYSGYRCFREKQTYMTDGNPLTFTTSTGPEIYCYAE